jgi:hypothetical protein
MLTNDGLANNAEINLDKRLRRLSPKKLEINKKCKIDKIPEKGN